MKEKTLFEHLDQLQSRHGFLRPEHLVKLSEKTSIPLATIHSAASFYPHFRFAPPPPSEEIRCEDVACHLRLDLKRTGKKATTLVSCQGRCEHAPVVTEKDRKVSHESSPFVIRHLDPYPEKKFRYGILEKMPDSGFADQIIQTLKDSGVRGMGGAGFPVGMKWDLVRKAAVRTPGEQQPGDPEPEVGKYVVCNADESEPGTFKDRMILQEACHLVLEGMLIAMKVVLAPVGIVFIRHEYKNEKEILQREIDRRKVPVRIFTSPGGYICGEETALLDALENKRGEPRHKPPFPGTHGLFAKPTLINNVETFAWIPAILHHGADWWKSFGQNGAKGLKLFALSGDVNRPGVYETPLGIKVSELIDSFGQGTREGRTLKAFMPGGASSGFLPASLADLPLDFKPLADAGSMLGSGGVIAIGEGACMLDLALNVTRFFERESCGKCVPCRVGTRKLVGILEGMRTGKRPPASYAAIRELHETMQAASICGLGQIAGTPLISALTHFEREIADHMTTGVCPSGACRQI